MTIVVPLDSPPPPTRPISPIVHDADLALVIDNGSFMCRAGWSNYSSPSLIFDNILQKCQTKKDKPEIIYTLGSSHSYPNSTRLLTRTAFDQQLVYQYEVMELTLDGIFSQLKLDRYPIDYPIVMTEPPCNPTICRKQMTELLFECYGSKKISYGCDALFSHYSNGPSPYSIIISSGYHSTHIIPVLSGRVDSKSVKRLSIGGCEMTDYLLRLLQCKYPTFPYKLSSSQARYILENYTFVAEQYLNELRQFASPETYQTDKDIAFQFPYTNDNETLNQDPAILAEEQARMQEKKEQFRTRMKQQAEQKRLEKLALLEKDLTGLEHMKDSKSLYIDEDDYIRYLKRFGYKSEQDLDDTIQQISNQVEKIRNKIAGVEQPTQSEKPSYNFDLLEIPDTELDEDQIKEKKRLRLIKASMEARERMKLEKEQEQQRLLEEEAKEEKKRQEDLEGWIKEKRETRQRLIEKLRRIKRIQQNLHDRKSQAATQRIKSLAMLAGEEEPTDTKKKKKTERDEDDGFGVDDKDWSVYRDVTNEEYEEMEENVENEIREVDEKLAKYDPDYWKLESEEDIGSGGLGDDISTFFYHGGGDGSDVAKAYQIHLNIERIRVPEVLFQPSIMGVDSAGIVEIINDTFQRYNNKEGYSIPCMLADDIFLTGGNVQYNGLMERLQNEIRAIRPTNSSFRIRMAKDPGMDSWNGAAKYARDYYEKSMDGYSNVWWTREKYEEEGFERLLNNISLPFMI